MKQIYKLKLNLSLRYKLLLIFLLTAYCSYTQIAGSSTVCPNEEVTYSDNNAPNGTITWSVTGGTFTTVNSGKDLKTVKIRWNNTTEQGSIKISVPIANDDPYVKTVNVGIKSVNNYTPKAIEVYQNNVKQTISSINGNNILKLDWCEGKTYTLFTKRENFPNTTTPIDWYIWQLPPGWQVVSNNVNHLGNNRYETASNDISVVPLKGDGGNTVNQIKVQA